MRSCYCTNSVISCFTNEFDIVDFTPAFICVETEFNYHYLWRYSPCSCYEGIWGSGGELIACVDKLLCQYTSLRRQFFKCVLHNSCAGRSSEYCKDSHLVSRDLLRRDFTLSPFLFNLLWHYLVVEHVIGWPLYDVSIRKGLKTSLLYPPICTPHLYVFTLTLLSFVYLPSFGHLTVPGLLSGPFNRRLHFHTLKFLLSIFYYKGFFFLFRRNNFPEVSQLQIISLTSLLSSGLSCCVFLQKCTDVSNEQVFIVTAVLMAYLCLIVVW